MVKTIEPQAFDMELQPQGEPFLVAFLKRNERFAFQAKAMEEACKSHGGEVRCFLYNADYLDTAMERFSVMGTPTFLFFNQGRVVNRLIGESDSETLGEFIRSSAGE